MEGEAGVDEYDNYDYVQDEILDAKGRRNRSKNETKHDFSSNRADRIHLESQMNNREKQMEATRRKSGTEK